MRNLLTEDTYLFLLITLFIIDRDFFKVIKIIFEQLIIMISLHFFHDIT